MGSQDMHMFLKNKRNKQRGFGWTLCWEEVAWITQSNSANRLGGGAGNKDTEMVQFHQIPCKSTPSLLADLYLFVHPKVAKNDQFYVFWSWSLQHTNQTSSKPWSPPLDKFWICSNSEVTLREWVCVALNIVPTTCGNSSKTISMQSWPGLWLYLSSHQLVPWCTLESVTFHRYNLYLYCVNLSNK